MLITRCHIGSDGLWSWAVYSADEHYRYCLGRLWGTSSVRPRFANFLMLNPSKATELANDPTVERCQRRAVTMGYDGLIVTNLFAWRATDPDDMKAASDPIGGLNDEIIITVAEAAAIIVCGWGADGHHLDRGVAVLTALRQRFSNKVHALHLNQDGQPGHPLYLPYSKQPVRL